MNKIICWSGNPDSTWALLQLLRNTNESVTVFHFSTNGTIQSQNERKAVRTLKPKLITQYGNRIHWVHYHTESVSSPAGALELTAYLAEVALYTDNAELIFARCEGEETDDRSFQVQHQDLLRLSFTFLELFAKITFVGDDVPKSQIKADLGDWWQHTQSCTDKIGSCGACFRCIQRKQAESATTT